MPLVNNKVGDDGTVGTDKALAEGQAMVDSLIKVVACYRHLASCVGGCTDSLQLRDELRQTREKAQKLAAANCHHLTSQLRNKSLPEEQRKEMELLWVAFSASLEQLHADMCKVFNVGDLFSLANSANLVQTGIQGGSSEVAARALSLSELSQAPVLPAGLEGEERRALEEQLDRADSMMDHMEEKVNVLRWTVESRGPRCAELPGSSDSASLWLLSVDEPEPPGEEPLCRRNQIFAALLLCTVALVAAALSVCIVFFS